MNELLKNILWKKNKQWQIIGASIGVFIGLLLLLSSIQLYADIKEFLSGGSQSKGQYVQINKKVNFLHMMGVKPNFTEEEIYSLDSLDFVNGVGKFSSSQFRVSASLPTFGFRTELFFESLPDEYIDIEEPSFKWKKGQKEIPIIISRDYLALYNFGFAPSQGLPAITPATIKSFSATIHVAGSGLRQSFEGKVVGLSDRINSILVPQSFMDWANDSFGAKKETPSSRLILAVDNPLSTEFQDYLKNNSYEVSQGRLIGGQFTVLLDIIIGIIAIIGFIIIVLSVLVFILNFQLIIAQAKEDIRLLLQLGYKEDQISTILIKRLALQFGVIVLITFLILFIGRKILVSQFVDQGLDLTIGLHWTVYLAAFLFIGIFSLLNYRNIKSRVAILFA